LKWIDLVEDREKWEDPICTVMNVGVSFEKMGISLLAEKKLYSQKGLYSLY
jgi:hypothetical protein